MVNQYGGKMPGAQGVPEDMLRKAASMAVCKINIDSDLRLAMTGTLRKYLYEHPEDFDPRKYMGPCRDAIREMVRPQDRGRARLQRQGVILKKANMLSCGAVPFGTASVCCLR